MTLEEISEILQETGLPVTYTSWPERQAPPLPYICYLSPYSNNFSADGIVYQAISHINIELYTKVKSPALESTLENVLAQNNIFWEKSEEYLSDQRCFEIIYEIEV